jgi:hypothetical protein
VRISIEERSIDHIRHLELRDRAIHALPILGIVFQVGILDDKGVSGDAREPGAQCGPLAMVLPVEQGAQVQTPLLPAPAGVNARSRFASVARLL